MSEAPEESDQLPEEGQPGTVHDDDGEGGGSEGSGKSPGVPGEEETGTGNPDNAGTEADG